MFCNKCGKQVADNIKFCNYCGSPLAGAVVQQGGGGNDSLCIKCSGTGMVRSTPKMLIAALLAFVIFSSFWYFIELAFLIGDGASIFIMLLFCAAINFSFFIGALKSTIALFATAEARYACFELDGAGGEKCSIYSTFFGKKHKKIRLREL